MRKRTEGAEHTAEFLNVLARGWRFAEDVNVLVRAARELADGFDNGAWGNMSSEKIRHALRPFSQGE